MHQPIKHSHSKPLSVPSHSKTFRKMNHASKVAMHHSRARSDTGQPLHHLSVSEQHLNLLTRAVLAVRINPESTASQNNYRRPFRRIPSSLGDGIEVAVGKQCGERRALQGECVSKDTYTRIVRTRTG